jgi:hypothetical protein
MYFWENFSKSKSSNKSANSKYHQSTDRKFKNFSKGNFIALQYDYNHGN